MTTRGLYVGRFQPFHLGHLDAIKEVLKAVDELVIAIGSAQYSHNLNNPFTAGERLVMVRQALMEADVDYFRIWMVPVPKSVAKFITEIDGVNRLRDLARTDRV